LADPAEENASVIKVAKIINFTLKPPKVVCNLRRSLD
jgi:hypothetical protein